MGKAIPAAAIKLQADGEEIAALLIENLIAAAEREGRAVEPIDYNSAACAMIAAGWIVAKTASAAAGADDRAAELAFARYLRRVADGIERDNASSTG